MKKFTFLLTLIVSSANIHASNGGQPVDYNKYPYIAAMKEYNYSWLFGVTHSNYCMASIISSNGAFTAAHCFTSEPTYTYKDLFAYSGSQLTAFPIESLLVDNNYKAQNIWDDGGIAYSKQRLPAQALTVDINFNPFNYITKQPGKEILFSFFGLDGTSLDKDKINIMTGTLSVMSGDKCTGQIQDLLDNEGSKFSRDTIGYLKTTKNYLEEYPELLFCVFNKKTDAIQATTGDSGSPLVINYNGKDIIAGVLTQGADISPSQKFSTFLLYTNIRNSYNFLISCQIQQKNNNAECMTLMQWWEQFKIDQNVYALKGVPGLTGIVRLLPQGESQLVEDPYYIQGTLIPW